MILLFVGLLFGGMEEWGSCLKHWGLDQKQWWRLRPSFSLFQLFPKVWWDKQAAQQNWTKSSTMKWISLSRCCAKPRMEPGGQSCWRETVSTPSTRMAPVRWVGGVCKWDHCILYCQLSGGVGGTLQTRSILRELPLAKVWRRMFWSSQGV